MLKKQFFSNWASLKSENGSCRMVALGLTAAVIVSNLANYYLYKEKTVVVIPPNVNKEFQVSGNELSRSYIEQIGYFLSDRVLSVSPGTVDSSFDSIVPFLTTSPDAIKTIREGLAEQAQAIKENDMFQVFYPMKVNINDKANKFAVEGSLRKMSGNNPISASKATIIFSFTVENGQMIITSLEVK